MWQITGWVLLFSLTCNFLLAEEDTKKEGFPIIGVYGGTGNSTHQKSAESGVNELYPSLNWWKSHEWYSSIAAQAHKNNIKMYPSFAVAYDGNSNNQHAFAKNNPQYFEKNRSGQIINTPQRSHLSWGHPEVRKFKVETFTHLVLKHGFDGVLLDYIRFFGTSDGYCEVIVSEFKAKHGRDPFKISPDDPQWVKFRADYVTLFIRELRQSFNKVDKDLKIIACVNADPKESLRKVMQDWETWVDLSLVDAVVTMIYENDTNNTLKLAMIADAATKGKVPLIHMLAAGYNGNLESPAQLLEASLKCLKAGAAGVAFYRSDSIRNFDHWSTINEIANWDKTYIDSQIVNYMLNPGFEEDLACWAVGDGNGVNITSEKARTGEKSLVGRFPGGMQVYQIVDRGFFLDRTTLEVSAWIDSEQMSGNGVLTLEVTANYHGGHEKIYHIDIEAGDTKGWHQVSGKVALANISELKFVIVGLTGNATGGKLYLDDIVVALTHDKIDPKQSLVKTAPISDANGRVNVALGQLVRGSSFWENGREYDNAVDGDISSDNLGKGASWHSQRPPLNQWIKIYLSKTHIVRKVRMLNSSANIGYRTLNYKIEVSTDDNIYRQVAIGILPDNGNHWTEVIFEPVEAKYIKFTGINGYTSTHAVGLKEIEVY
jgi:hypothetical protein